MRRLILTLAALAAVSAGLLVAVPQQAEAANRYPICVENRAGSYMNGYVHGAAYDWNVGTYRGESLYVTKKSPGYCSKIRTALTIHVVNVWWGRNGTLGTVARSWRGAHRSGSGWDWRPYYCKVYVNRSYAQTSKTRYQRTIAHEIGHCLQMYNDKGRHFSGHTIYNPYRYSVHPTRNDFYYVGRRWNTYTGYGR